MASSSSPSSSNIYARQDLTQDYQQNSQNPSPPAVRPPGYYIPAVVRTRNHYDPAAIRPPGYFNPAATRPQTRGPTVSSLSRHTHHDPIPHNQLPVPSQNAQFSHNPNQHRQSSVLSQRTQSQFTQWALNYSPEPAMNLAPNAQNLGHQDMTMPSYTPAPILGTTYTPRFSSFPATPTYQQPPGGIFPIPEQATARNRLLPPRTPAPRTQMTPEEATPSSQGVSSSPTGTTSATSPAIASSSTLQTIASQPKPPKRTYDWPRTPSLHPDTPTAKRSKVGLREGEYRARYDAQASAATARHFLGINFGRTQTAPVVDWEQPPPRPAFSKPDRTGMGTGEKRKVDTGAVEGGSQKKARTATALKAKTRIEMARERNQKKKRMWKKGLQWQTDNEEDADEKEVEDKEVEDGDDRGAGVGAQRLKDAERRDRERAEEVRRKAAEDDLAWAAMVGQFEDELNEGTGGEDDGGGKDGGKDKGQDGEGDPERKNRKKREKRDKDGDGGLDDLFEDSGDEAVPGEGPVKYRPLRKL